MRTTTTLPGLSLALLLWTGCYETSDNIVGPSGRPGPPGPPGRDASVSSVEFMFFLDEARVSDDEFVSSAQYEVSALTPSVVDDGAVLVYFRSQGTWTALPFTLGREAPDAPLVDYTATLGYAFEYDDEARTGFIEIFLEASTNDGHVWEELAESDPFTDGVLLKAVLIDGFPAAKTAVDLRDYEAVEAYFGLDE